MTKPVLIVVVTYNAMQWIDRCLGNAIKAADMADTLVVDNASTDGTAEYIAEHFPSVRLIACKDNPGFGASNNIGLSEVITQGYSYAYLLNQDAWPEEGTIKALVHAMEQDPRYGILSPVQRSADGKLDRRFKAKCGSFLDKASGTVEVPFVMAAHWLVSSRAIRAVGGFSPTFRQYGEDDNYIDRLHFHGFLCGVVTSTSAVHDRAQRPEDKSKRIRLKCIAVEVRLSNPAHNFALRRILAPLELAGMSIKSLSAMPLRYIPVLIGRLKAISENRCRSMSESAFLTLEKSKDGSSGA